MRTDKKRAPALIMLYIAAVAALVALTITGQMAADMFGHKSQLLAEPLTRGGAGVDIWDIEDFQAGASTLVTYEIRQQASAGAVRQTHRMTVIGTNSSLNGVMGYPVADGGFFTESAFLLGSREAVLNERAASALFGGGRLSGSTFLLDEEAWQVVGVIIDGDDENANIYIPATSYLFDGGAGAASGQGVSAGALMVLQGGYSDADAAIAISKLRDMGISDSSHSFKSLGKAVAAFGEMASIAQSFTLTLLLCLFAWYSARSAFRIIMAARAENAAHSQVVGGDVRAGYFRAIIYTIFFVLCAAAALFLARRIVGICITWQEIPLLLFASHSPQDAFYGRLNTLANRQTATLLLFAASAAISAIAAIYTAYAIRD